MQYYLGQHPDIFMYSGPEPHFFGSDVRLSWFPRLTEETYLQLFSEAKDETLVGEKSTSYLASERAAEEIKAFSPDAYIIAMLRNPVDLVYSLHSELLFMGVETIPDFLEAITTEAERTTAQRAYSPDAPNVSARVYREAVRYAEQLQRYFDIFGRDRVHVIIYDDLKQDTAAVYAKTLRYLKMGEEFRPDFVVVNPNKRHRSVFIQRPPALALRLAKAIMPKHIRRKLKTGLENLNTVEESRRPLDRELRVRLQAEFSPDVQRLSRLLDRDLSIWMAV